MQQFGALVKRQPRGAIPAVVGVVAGGLVAEQVDGERTRNRRLQQIHDVAVVGNRDALARRSCLLRAGEDLVQIARRQIDPALVESGLDAGVVHLRKHADRARDERGLGLRAAHAAEAGGDEDFALEVALARHAEIFAPDAKNRVKRAVDDPLRADVHPAAGGHLPIVGNAHLLGDFPIVDVIEHADHQRVGEDHARSVGFARKETYGMPGFEHQRLLVGEFFQILFDQAVLQPVLADLPRLAIGHELIGIQRHVKIEIVVDHHLQGAPGEAVSFVCVDGLAVDAPFGTITVGIDAPAGFQLLQKLRRKRFVKRLRHIAQGVLERLPRLRGAQAKAAIRRAAFCRVECGHFWQRTAEANVSCARGCVVCHCRVSSLC